MARRCMTMTCCGKYWKSPIITSIVKRENMVTVWVSTTYLTDGGSPKKPEDTPERGVASLGRRLTAEKFLPRFKHRERQGRLELDSLLP